MSWSRPRCLDGAIVPRARAAHAMCLLTSENEQQTVILFGGADSTPTFFNDAFALDTDSWMWTSINAQGDHPCARSSHSLVANGNCAILYGGSSILHGKQMLFDDVWILNQHLQVPGQYLYTWHQQSTTGDRPPPLNAHTASVIGSNMWIFGGSCESKNDYTSIEPTNALYCLDLERWVWKKIEVCGFVPKAREMATITALPDGRLWLLGGRSKTEVLEESSIFDPKTRQWTYCPPFYTRLGHSAAILGDRIVTYGGWDGHSLCNTLLFYPIGIADYEWTHVQLQSEHELGPGACFSHACIPISNNRLLFFGGCRDGIVTNHLVILQDGDLMKAWDASESMVDLSSSSRD